MNWFECIALFLVAGVATMLLVPVAKRIAIHFDAIDYPSARRVNMLPVPRMGGIALLGGLIVALAVLFVGVGFLGWKTPLYHTLI